MKLVKMSLAAAVLLGASAFAIDNIKVSGDAKLLYGTNDADYVVEHNSGPDTKESGLFEQGASYADTALRLGVTGDLLKGVSFGVTGYAVSSLGLENNLVSNVWTGAHGVNQDTTTSTDVEDQSWIGELWLATTMGKTTAKVGRMQLDTPLAFSETWSIAPNTFEAAVLINQDIPDTTLVGAWVGKGNGVNHLSPLGANDNDVYPLGFDGLMGADAKFVTYGDSGAYAAGIVNNSFKPLTAQAWYYNVANVADAYWLQADVDCSLVKGVKIGAQYADIDPKGVVDSTVATINPALAVDNSSAYAFKLGYDGIENLHVHVAYSEVDEDGVLNIANTATNNLTVAQSKLYTEAWMNYGYVGAPGAESVNVTAEYTMKDVAKFGAYYTDVSIDDTNPVSAYLSSNGASRSAETDMTEIALTATKSFGPLDATLAYYSTDADDQNNGDQYNTIQAYLTLNF